MRKKNKSEIMFFPYIFFMIGLLLQLFSSLTDSFWLGMGIMLIGLQIYFLAYFWFIYEVDRLC